MSDQSSCNRVLLQKVISGLLPEPSELKLEEHLESCDRCKRELENLAAGKSEWQKLSDYFSIEPETNVQYDGPPTVDIQLNPAASSGFLIVDLAQKQRENPHSFLQNASHPELLGRLDGFQVERVIGQGGMGIVYKGFDTELNRPVAIKVLIDHLAANGAARKRFAREARAAAAVIHPNVVPIHSVNSSADRPYIVMSLVSGRSLQSHVAEEGPLTVKEVVRIAKQIASGLAAAHAQGLVHRDIKPANILLEKDVSRVMITDFGLARAADDAAITQTGWLAGTPHYMSPEQSSGLEVDHRSDLFSLGSVMYFMATGREPFRAEMPVAVLKKISADEPEPVRSVNSDITKTLARIIERLMAKESARRFSTAEDVDQVLTQYLAHLEQPRNQPKPKVKAVRRTHWLRVAIGTLVFAASVLATWWMFLPPASENNMPTGLQNVDWQYELNELNREIGELENRQLTAPSFMLPDSLDTEIQNLDREIQRLETDLQLKLIQ